VRANKGFGLSMYLVVLALVAGAMFGAFIYGAKVEAENWIPIVANLEGELNDFKAESAEREKRAAKAAKDATASLIKARKEVEAERAQAGEIPSPPAELMKPPLAVPSIESLRPPSKSGK
jgi:hypothetical protein